MTWRREIPSTLAGIVCNLALAVVLILSTGTAAGATVRVTVPSSVPLGGSFSARIDVELVVDLYGAQFSLTFDPSVLRADHVTEGDFLKQGGASTFWIPPVIDNNAGTITGAAVTRLGPIPGVTGSGTIASISFYAKSTGSSLLGLNDVILSDSNAQPISFHRQNGSVSIVPPPSPPETWITSGPSGTIHTTTATFTWSGSDQDGYVTHYRYMMDGQGWVTTSQTSHTFTGLAKGSHTFYVAAVDNDGLSDPSPASRSFDVHYTANPDTLIVSGPSGTVEGDTVSFEWMGTDPDGWVVSYLYRLDDLPWSHTTQTRQTFTNLSYGNHTFQVKAVDDEGLEDLTPAQQEFTLIPFWWQDEIARLNDIVLGLQDDLRNVTAELEMAQMESQALQQERDRLQGQLSTLQSLVSTLQAQRASLQSQVTALENERTMLQVEIDDLENATAHLGVAIEDLEQRLQTAQNRNQALSQEMEMVRGQLSQARLEWNLTKSRLEITEQEKTSLQTQVAALQGQTSYLEQRLNELSDQIANLSVSEQSLIAEKRLAWEERVRLEAQMGDLQTQVLNRDSELARMTEEAVQRQSEVDRLEGEKKAAASVNDLLEARNQSLVRAKQVLQAALGATVAVALILLVLVARSPRGSRLLGRGKARRI